MRRRLRAFILWTSLAAAALLLGVWVMSVWYTVEIRKGADVIRSHPGRLLLFWETPFSFDAASLISRVDERANWNFPHGWWFEHDSMSWPGGPPMFHALYVPYWPLILLTAAPAAWILFRDRRRLPPGHCTKCRYDLRGSASQSAVCPECGG